MKCQRCNKADAVFSFTMIEKGTKDVSTVELCHVCASDMSPYIARMMQRSGINELLSELIKGKMADEAATSVGAEALLPDVEPCSTCGLKFEQYKATLMLGCPDCYDSFGEHLLADIRRMQGTDAHLDVPGPAVEDEPVTTSAVKGTPPAPDAAMRLKAMRAELQDCIENEDFERAAFLRDEIRKLSTEAGPK